MTTVPSSVTVVPGAPQVGTAPRLGDLPTTTVMPPVSTMVPAVVTPPTELALIDAPKSQVVVANRPRPLTAVTPHVSISFAGLATIGALLSLDMAGPALVVTGVTALVHGATLLAHHLKATRGGEQRPVGPILSPRLDVDAILARFEAAARDAHPEGVEGDASQTPETIEELRRLQPFFDQQVSEASRWGTWSADAKSLQRAFSFLADRVRPLDRRLAAIIENAIDEASATSREQEKVEDILRPAAAYISARLKRGPVDAQTDLRQIGAMFDQKIGEAKRWDGWNVEAQALQRAFCYTTPLIAKHDPMLAAFIRKSLDEADAASRWQEKVEDVLRPAATYVSRSLRGQRPS